MPRTKSGSFPAYRLHKPTGQAVVTIDGRDNYLGRHGTVCSKQKYQRLVDRWLSQEEEVAQQPAAEITDAPTVNEIILAFIRHAESYYKADANGEQTEVGCIKDASRILKQLFGGEPADQFGPRALKQVRQQMVEKDWCRNYINHQVNRIRRMFRWATEEEMIPATVYHALQAVRGLRTGLPGVRESKKVRPVAVSSIKKVLGRVPPMVKAMILVWCFE